MAKGKRKTDSFIKAEIGHAKFFDTFEAVVDEMVEAKILEPDFGRRSVNASRVPGN